MTEADCTSEAPVTINSLNNVTFRKAELFPRKPQSPEDGIQLVGTRNRDLPAFSALFL
jgi:hypothetical protein